jgi:hypothetical protein
MMAEEFGSALRYFEAKPLTAAAPSRNSRRAIAFGVRIFSGSAGNVIRKREYLCQLPESDRFL